jgi:hypothetical protein
LARSLSIRVGPPPDCLDEIESLGFGGEVEADFGRSLGKFDGRKEAKVKIGADVFVKRLFGFPLLGVKDVVVQEIFFREPATHATGARPGKIDKRTQNLEELAAILQRGREIYHRKDYIARLLR